jgi:hypothetical protein
MPVNDPFPFEEFFRNHPEHRGGVRPCGGSVTLTGACLRAMMRWAEARGLITPEEARGLAQREVRAALRRFLRLGSQSAPHDRN